MLRILLMVASFSSVGHNRPYLIQRLMKMLQSTMSHLDIKNWLLKEWVARWSQGMILIDLRIHFQDHLQTFLLAMLWLLHHVVHAIWYWVQPFWHFLLDLQCWFVLCGPLWIFPIIHLILIFAFGSLEVIMRIQ